MPNYQSFPIDNSFRIELYPLSQEIQISDEDKQKIEIIWQNEKSKRPSLYNGKILSVVEFDISRVVGYFVEYKYLLAQVREPDLQKALNIIPACVSGVTYAGNKILFAKRSAEVTQSPHAFECVPSGGIDTQGTKEGEIDILIQFQQELEEESGLTQIQSCKFFELIYSPQEPIFEICAEIELDPQEATKLPSRNIEYTEFIWVDKEDVPAFCNDPNRSFVPLSLHMLRTLKLLS